jgi:hypothetical protein
MKGVIMYEDELSLPPTPEAIDNYNDFWKPILEDENGNINKDQLIKEFADFSYVMDQVPQVYCEICNLSKLTYPAEVIINELHEKWSYNETAYYDLCSMIDELELPTKQSIKDMLQDYFNI